MISSTPCTTGYDRNMPPEEAQAPIEITHFGSGIWSKMRFTAGAIFLVTVPATIIRAAWRGENRRASAPDRATSLRGATMTIRSMAQHASPHGLGHRQLLPPHS